MGIDVDETGLCASAIRRGHLRWIGATRHMPWTRFGRACGGRSSVCFVMGSLGTGVRSGACGWRRGNGSRMPAYNVCVVESERGGLWVRASAVSYTHLTLPTKA